MKYAEDPGRSVMLEDIIPPVQDSAKDNVNPFASMSSCRSDATIEITDINFHDDEVTADIHLDVSNFLQMDTLGTEAHSVSKATFVIPMTIHGGKWKVDLKAIPQKEKISQ